VLCLVFLFYRLQSGHWILGRPPPRSVALKTSMQRVLNDEAGLLWLLF
jgi:hypothetical protein